MIAGWITVFDLGTCRYGLKTLKKTEIDEQINNWNSILQMKR